MLEVNKTYKTYGEWDALVIWQCFSPEDENHVQSFYAVHKPKTEDETICLHDENGVACSMFAVNEPPTYNIHHPADIVID
jgi:hypothetical protein